jgi:hypothetical protein
MLPLHRATQAAKRIELRSAKRIRSGSAKRLSEKVVPVLRVELTGDDRRSVAVIEDLERIAPLGIGDGSDGEARQSRAAAAPDLTPAHTAASPPLCSLSLHCATLDTPFLAVFEAFDGLAAAVAGGRPRSPFLGKSS